MILLGNNAECDKLNFRLHIWHAFLGSYGVVPLTPLSKLGSFFFFFAWTITILRHIHLQSIFCNVYMIVHLCIVG
uniref:Uncharacterized protein n=1 Tax=Aegilops tauschii subsp. strangulata TaxID=200361 RepID=A0A453P5P1_AEGTS